MYTVYPGASDRVAARSCIVARCIALFQRSPLRSVLNRMAKTQQSTMSEPPSRTVRRAQASGTLALARGCFTLTTVTRAALRPKTVVRSIRSPVMEVINPQVCRK
jgi:hypothetical protein